MNSSNALKLMYAMFALLLVAVSVASAAPAPYTDYDNNVRDLLEFLMQRETGYEDRLGMHQVVRKAGRSPQLRLRFGKRPDPGYPASPFLNSITEADQ